jgi:hypothetical protein
MLRIPPKVVSVLCVFQVFAIMLGYLITRAFYKVYTTAADAFTPAPPNWMTRLMLALGPWLLLLPLAWGAVATLTANLDAGIAEVSQRQTRIGYVMSIGIALFCALSAWGMFIVSVTPGSIQRIPGTN